MNDLINNGIRYLNTLMHRFQQRNQTKIRQQYSVGVTTNVELTKRPEPAKTTLSLLAKVKLMGQTHDCLFETVPFDSIRESDTLMVISTDRYVLVLKQITGKVLDRNVVGMAVRVARESMQGVLHTKKYSLLAVGPVISIDSSEGREKITFGGESPMSLGIRRLSPYN